MTEKRIPGLGPGYYAKLKPARKKKRLPCAEKGCERPKVPQSTKWCGWHWLLSQPIEVQERAACTRLERTPPERYRARVPKESWPEGCRWCAGCQSHVPLFYATGSRCRACSSLDKHSSHVARTYGLPRDHYRRMLEHQQGRCAGCRCVPRSRRLAVDHDHERETEAGGGVRGLLCTQCNDILKLAAFHGKPLAVLANLVGYLEDPPASILAS